MEQRTVKQVTFLLLAAAGVTLCACSSKGDVSLGGGQAPVGVATDFAIAYIKRVLPADATAMAQLRTSDDLRQQRDLRSKADLWIRDKAAPSGVERNITARITGNDFYDVRDLDVSADGTRLIFAMRGPLRVGQREQDPPTWGIWEYTLATDQLRRVIADDTTAAAGQDVSPHYLPDGRILFVSTRQRDAKSILIDEGKSGFEAQAETINESAFVMHVMNADGSLGSIHQISYNQAHDLNPTLRADGRVMWSRWDAESGNANTGMHLYVANPDGSNLQLLYGARSHASGSPTAAGAPSTVQFVQAREMEDHRVLALTRSFAGADFGGSLVIIDTNDYVEIAQRTLAGVQAGVPANGPAQVAAVQTDVRTVAGPSPGGRFNYAWPLWDHSNRALVSWSQCRLLDSGGNIVACTDDRVADPNAQLAPPLYSAWMLDLAQGTLKPVITPAEGVMIEDIVSLQARTAPQYIPDTQPAQALAPDLGVGILDIRSVYDFDGAPWSGLNGATLAQVAARPAAQRPARFLRVEKAVSIPDRDTRNFDRTVAFGRAGNFMREILGYVPIEPDGSVRVRVPANVAFNVSVLDANGRRLFAPNRVWQQLRPGEVADCNGCYYAPTGTGSSGLSHGRRGLFNSLNAGTAGGCAGETMAQAKSLWNCNNAPYAAPALSMNLIFDGSATGDPSISLRYNDLATPLPTRQSCLAAWSSGCRSTISYPLNIKQLWTLVRPDGPDADTLPDTCTDCHNGSPRDAANVVKSAAAQLNLTDDTAQATPALQAQRSYDQLTLGFGFVIDVPNPADPATTILVAAPGNEPASLSAGSASASARFFSIFAPGGSHAGRLSGAELRLVAEWVDIGAQFYNNPFDAPLN